MSGDAVVSVSTGQINLSPTAAQVTAQHFLKAYLDFKSPDNFSIVPYFLCCRAMEMAFKSVLLETNKKEFVKKQYGHDLEDLYQAVPAGRFNLHPKEIDLLFKVNKLYATKQFEYHIDVTHMVSGYSTFPDLAALAGLAQKVVAGIS